jgi:sodium-coupled neutral amino acid transporter 9
MMGTSLLSMPWALEQAGVVFGMILLLGMGALACYTAYRVVQSPDGLRMFTSLTLIINHCTALGIDSPEFSHVCGFFWGRTGEWIATIFSLVVMVGGSIAYWVLMSNFMYYTGVVVHGTDIMIAR